MIEKILKLMAENRHTAVHVEEQLKLSKGRIGKWRDGIGEPSAVQARDIARYYKVPIEYLVDDSIESVDEISPVLKPWEIEMLKNIRVMGEHEARHRLIFGPSASIASDPAYQAIPKPRR